MSEPKPRKQTEAERQEAQLRISRSDLGIKHTIKGRLLQAVRDQISAMRSAFECIDAGRYKEAQARLHAMKKGRTTITTLLRILEPELGAKR